MRAKRVTAGRGVGGSEVLAEHREVYAGDCCGDSDALWAGNSVAWAINSKRPHP